MSEGEGGAKPQRSEATPGEVRIFGLPIELKTDPLAIVAFVLSVLGLGLAGFASLQGSDIRVVRSGTIYIAADNTGGASTPLLIVTDILLFNRAGNPYSDVVTDYEIVATFSDGQSVCMRQSNAARVVWLGEARTDRLAQVGVAEADSECGDCLAYNRLRIERLGSAVGLTVAPGASAMQTIEFTLNGPGGCNEQSAEILRGLTFEQFLERLTPQTRFELRVATYLDPARTYTCEFEFKPEYAEATLRRGWMSNVCEPLAA